MFKSRDYRAMAIEYGELVKSSTNLTERRGFQELEERFASLADNEEGLADVHDGAVHVASQHRSRGAALAGEEEYVLRCLGAAIIMQWDSIPTLLRREIFDAAGSVGQPLNTAVLRGQIARFLHKHNGLNTKLAE